MAFTRQIIRDLAMESGIEIPKELADALVSAHMATRDAYAEEQVQAELEKAKKEQEATKSLMLDSMQGTADLYVVEQENKQLQLDAMQGIADLYAMQMGGGQ